MSNLLYKTRSNITCQGKPKVYFCSHPEDFCLYFDKISDEILKAENCSVWYKKDYSCKNDEEFFSDIERMQLFVVPVTTLFLTTDNAALKEEFEFAQKKHIPILPLMQENGLEAIFNKKCGDLQFLNASQSDATAISYEEKLKKYLSSVLIGDELAEKIRAAFDAYVFLSYRKKDRKYANELMRLIHKNDFCRDIAIWYDEFLTPGENFNDSIQSALEKSELFVMAVTPNIVEEENYIMTTEYPMAKEGEKEIISAELIPTDKNMLLQKYESLPPCVDAYDDEALAEALKKAISRVALSESENSPEHRFFIGLAYLGGVDVEVEHKMAAELIESAANDGLVQAKEKLVAMYKNGEGVGRELDKAIGWQRKVVEYYIKDYIDNPIEDTARKLMQVFLDLGADLYSLRRLDEAKEMYLEMLEVFNSDRNLRYAASAHIFLGDIARAEGSVDEARKCSERAICALKEVVDKEPTIKAKHNLATAYIHFGDTALLSNLKSEAKQYYELAADTIKDIVKKDDVVKRKALAVCYNNLGSIAVFEKNSAEAEKYINMAFDIFKNIDDETDGIFYKRDLALCYDNFGDLELLEGRASEAEKYYNLSLDTRRGTLEFCNTIEARRDIAISYNRLAKLESEKGEYESAVKYYNLLIDVLCDIAAAAETIEALKDVSLGYMGMSEAKENAGDASEAKAYFKKALDVKKKIAETTRSVTDKRGLAVAYEKMGGYVMGEVKASEAKNYYKLSLDVFCDIERETKTATAKRDVFVLYERLGDIEKLEGNMEKAEEYYVKSVELRKKVAIQTGTMRSFDEYAMGLYNLGKITNDMKHLREAYEVWDKLSERYPEEDKFKSRKLFVKMQFGEW